MDVFFSWSGERSKQTAEMFGTWLKCVIQAVEPWVSSHDIDSGSLWSAELSEQLSQTKIGIICLTRENMNKPWILFEAGALAKGLSTSRVCPILIDIEQTDVVGPIAQFNASKPDKDGIYKLLTTLNKSLEASNSLAPEVLERVFETYWPQFKDDFATIQSNTESIVNEDTPVRPEGEVLSEVLTVVRSMEHKIRRLESEKKSSNVEIESWDMLLDKVAEGGMSENETRVLIENLLKHRKIMKKYEM